MGTCALPKVPQPKREVVEEKISSPTRIINVFGPANGGKTTFIKHVKKMYHQNINHDLYTKRLTIPQYKIKKIVVLL